LQLFLHHLAVMREFLQHVPQTTRLCRQESFLPL
jgi:hypothetical protein